MLRVLIDRIELLQAVGFPVRRLASVFDPAELRSVPQYWITWGDLWTSSLYS